ncbi:hypothetical protein F5887DRAFT_1072586 [Amanita rubescens]|nr:hypothetical protein F5887DRAFT_1072586 [Amanita rubescens]
MGKKRRIPIPHSGASKRGKENITPFSEKREACAFKVIAANEHKVKNGADIKCLGSIAKSEEEDSFTRPVLADLSSIMVEALELDFDHNVIDYDKDWDTGLDAAAETSTPKKKRLTLFCAESLSGKKRIVQGQLGRGRGGLSGEFGIHCW